MEEPCPGTLSTRLPPFPPLYPHQSPTDFKAWTPASTTTHLHSSRLTFHVASNLPAHLPVWAILTPKHAFQSWGQSHSRGLSASIYYISSLTLTFLHETRYGWVISNQNQNWQKILVRKLKFVPLCSIPGWGSNLRLVLVRYSFHKVPRSIQCKHECNLDQ